jgi:hypothetical protein
MDAHNIEKAREISVQLLQLCHTKQLPLLSNILQFLVRFKSNKKLSFILFLKTVNNVIEPDNLLPYAPSSDSSSLFNRLLIELASIHRLRYLPFSLLLNNLVFNREILENSTTSETNESLKNAFDRIVTLPLRSALPGYKSTKDLTPRENNNNGRSDRTLTSYDKYRIDFDNMKVFALFFYRHRLLTEAGRLSLLLRYTDLTRVILDALSNIRLKVGKEEEEEDLRFIFYFIKEPEYLLEVRLLQAEYMVKSLGDNEQLYSKSSVEVRRFV